jgi:pimeloyl-ACP methyl ester carboxylesterase
LNFQRATTKTAWIIDSSPHTVLFVTVDNDVKLEVLDWGGTGSPLVFLAGFGNTAHVFDKFAPKFTTTHHVYGITRRGFGLSSSPPPTVGNFDPDRLGDDVLAVIAALHIKKPILVGHSIAGQELSSIGTRHPEMVAGLIYLDAAYHYAFYNPKSDILYPEAAAMLRDLMRLPAANPQESRILVAKMRDALPSLQKGLSLYLKALEGQPELSPAQQYSSRRLVQNAVVASEREYGRINAPILAIFAVPHECKPKCGTPSAIASAATDAAQADFVQAENPKARVVRLPYANHYVFQSNEADVLREMKAFTAGLH